MRARTVSVSLATTACSRPATVLQTAAVERTCPGDRWERPRPEPALVRTKETQKTHNRTTCSTNSAPRRATSARDRAARLEAADGRQERSKLSSSVAACCGSSSGSCSTITQSSNSCSAVTAIFFSGCSVQCSSKCAYTSASSPNARSQTGQNTFMGLLGASIVFLDKKKADENKRNKKSVSASISCSPHAAYHNLSLPKSDALQTPTKRKTKRNKRTQHYIISNTPNLRTFLTISRKKRNEDASTNSGTTHNPLLT
jgi:hypothetical protein